MSAQTPNESTATATVTGAVGGTLLVGFINIVPDEWKISKQIIIMLAPIITVTLRSVYLWIQKRLTRRVNIWEDREELNIFISTIEETLEKQEISEKHRQALIGKLEEARLIFFEKQLERLKTKKK